ncbi:MAG: TIGR02281 family clan AA aspartic protease [Pseudomonadota bacterium]
MNTGDWAQLTYLILLGIAVGGWFMAESRNRMGKTLRMALVWFFIFLGAIAGVGLWDDIRTNVAPRQTVFADTAQVVVPRNADGHYYLTLDVNNRSIDFVVDTGATDMVLTRADAIRVGIDPDALTFTGIAGTANGTVRTAPVRLDDVTLGPITDRGVRAVVNEGEMETSLLGMTYLQRFGRIEIEAGELILTR